MGLNSEKKPIESSFSEISGGFLKQTGDFVFVGWGKKEKRNLICQTNL